MINRIVDQPLEHREAIAELLAQETLVLSGDSRQSARLLRRTPWAQRMDGATVAADKENPVGIGAFRVSKGHADRR